MKKMGSIHGRFQPFHSGHLEYAMRAFELCDHLFIGITQHNIDALRWSALDVARHRSEPSSNPFTYAERAQIIEAALLEEGISRDRFTITPFPIETPAEIGQYISRETLIYTTIYDDWNRSKIELLKQNGYTVKVLWERDKKAFEGRKIRDLLLAQDDQWKEFVPAGAIETIEKIWQEKN